MSRKLKKVVDMDCWQEYKLKSERKLALKQKEKRANG